MNLRRRIADGIDKGKWTSLSADVTGDIHEDLKPWLPAGLLFYRKPSRRTYAGPRLQKLFLQITILFNYQKDNSV